MTTVPTELGGTTKLAGIYDSAATTFGITGTLTLDAQGDPDAVFIFQMGSTLTTASDSRVVLANSAQACHVFWQVGSSATLGTNSIFKGSILALTSITLNTGANVEGRVLARNGAVTLDGNTVTRAICAPASIPPLINVTKVPDTLASLAPASVTYDYTITNVGTVAMTNITVADDKCAPVVYVAGDTNSNSQLDTAENWQYSCTTTVSETTTNTVTTTGRANGFTATDTASTTVVIGSLTPAPLIHLVKTPDVFVLPTIGGLVNYTYTVTNPGTEPLSDVSVTDNKCSPMSDLSGGDDNVDNLLDPAETWTYSCASNLTRTTTNTGTAVGTANGLTATDSSLATVTVVHSSGAGSAPEVTTPTPTPTTATTTITQLPVTGSDPIKRNMPWYIAITVAILTVLTSIYIVRRKQKTSD